MSDPQDPSAGGLNRRQWLLRLGETTVLVGFSGLLGELLPAEAASSGEPAASPQLPPGLYLPSPEHLGHSMAAIVARSAPPGCETEFAPPLTEPFTPAFFTTGEWEAVQPLVRMLLGEVRVFRTQATVPAPAPAVAARIHAEVAQWIDRELVAAAGRRAAALALDPLHRQLTIASAGESAWRNLLDDPQPDWRAGLAWLEEESRARFSAAFAVLPSGRQTELLRTMAAAPGHGQPAVPGQRLFTRLKDGVIRGFYTSQTGLYELGYRGNSYFTESPGCPAGEVKS